jgi:hypothetical protein
VSKKHRKRPEYQTFCRQLYHACLARVFAVLRPSMTTPEVARCPDGYFRRVIFSLGPYIADYPEQVWLAGIVQNWCAGYIFHAGCFYSHLLISLLAVKRPPMILITVMHCHAFGGSAHFSFKTLSLPKCGTITGSETTLWYVPVHLNPLAILRCHSRSQNTFHEQISIHS